MNKNLNSDPNKSFFIKCVECKSKPATIKCFDCQNIFGENQNKFCYTCDSKLHTNQRDQLHQKEIIPYNEMYNNRPIQSNNNNNSIQKYDSYASNFDIRQGSSSRSLQQKSEFLPQEIPIKDTNKDDQKLRIDTRKKEILQNIEKLNKKLHPVKYTQSILETSQNISIKRVTDQDNVKTPYNSSPQPKPYKFQQKDYSPRQTEEDSNMNEFRYKLKLQESYQQITQLKTQLQIQQRQSELDLKKQKEQNRICQEEALRQIEKQNQNFDQERQELQSTIAQLQDILEEEVSKNEEITNQFMQYQQECEQEKLSVQEMKAGYEERQQQLESLLQEQTDKIIEMQKAYQDDPLLKLLNENPDLLNTIEQLTQEKQDNNDEQYEVNLGQKLQEYEEIIQQNNQTMNEQQQNIQIKDLEIQKMQELIQNLKQLYEEVVQEKEHLQEENENIGQQLEKFQEVFVQYQQQQQEQEDQTEEHEEDQADQPQEEDEEVSPSGHKN